MRAKRVWGLLGRGVRSVEVIISNSSWGRDGNSVWPSENTSDDCGVCHGAPGGGAGAPTDDGGVRRHLCRCVRSFDEVGARQ